MAPRLMSRELRCRRKEVSSIETFLRPPDPEPYHMESRTGRQTGAPKMILSERGQKRIRRSESHGERKRIGASCQSLFGGRNNEAATSDFYGKGAEGVCCDRSQRRSGEGWVEDGSDEGNYLREPKSVDTVDACGTKPGHRSAVEGVGSAGGRRRV